MNRVVGFVVSGFEFAVGAVSGIGLMMETAVGQRSAQALVEKQEQQCDLESLAGEAVGVMLAIALEQRMALELAKVVTQLIQAV